ncbi:SWI/SNF and RSC complex subunit Ssr3 [Teratosphaeriaceae sp. CCFEE 6253]|nr:SWI/SNF and RSC complex subunit Ssr3 [Teratosphaeriaceae sp. CCFEE 6253]
MATPRSGHARKISFADLERTFRAAGPMVPPPHAAHAQPTLTPAQLQAQRIEELRRQDAARRSSRKPTDREIPDELNGVIVGDGVERYRRLRDVERKLDAVMMRKRLDISDNLQRRYTRREGLMRVWISNTAEGQPWQVMEEGGGMGDDGAFDLGENSQATFRVKIEGRLLDDPDEDDDDAEREKQRPKLSSFFKSITIDFSRASSLNPDSFSAIEWRKPQPNTQNSSYDANSSEVSFDTLEFERKSEDNINVTINLIRDEKNERFRLSPLLADIVDEEESDRAGAVQGVWEYCRAMGLQEDEERRSVVCDDALRKLFDQDKVYFPYVPDLLHPHLHPLPPIQLSYTIRVDKAYINDPVPTIYDIPLLLTNSTNKALTRFHTSKAHSSTLSTILRTDDDLALLVQKITNTNGKRKFYDSLARDPASFVKKWVGSQQRDLEVVLAEASRGGGEDAQGEEWRKGGKESVWGSTMAQESVGLYLARGGKASGH